MLMLNELPEVNLRPLLFRFLIIFSQSLLREQVPRLLIAHIHNNQLPVILHNCLNFLLILYELLHVSIIQLAPVLENLAKFRSLIYADDALIEVDALDAR